MYVRVIIFITDYCYLLLISVSLIDFFDLFLSPVVNTIPSQYYKYQTRVLTTKFMGIHNGLRKLPL